MAEQRKGSERYDNDQMSFHDEARVEIGGFPKRSQQLRLTDIESQSPATIKMHPTALLRVLVCCAYKL